jgi:predicted acyltransferase
MPGFNDWDLDFHGDGPNRTALPLSGVQPEEHGSPAGLFCLDEILSTGDPRGSGYEEHLTGSANALAHSAGVPALSGPGAVVPDPALPPEAPEPGRWRMSAEEPTGYPEPEAATAFPPAVETWASRPVEPDAAALGHEAHARRLPALDAFRGITILGLLIVNNLALGEATPPQLRLTHWNGGVHLADMLFPWLILILGFSVPFSARLDRGSALPRQVYHARALGRAALLFLLGCIIDSSIARQPVLGIGGLQLAGLTYLVAALLYDVRLAGRLTIAAALLAAYWVMVRFLAAPGVSPGDFADGRNFVHYLAQAWLDPRFEGFVYLMPASALALIGMGLGELVRRRPESPRLKAALLLSSGLALASAGYFWSLSLPFCRPLWTPSFVLWAGGWGVFTLGLFYLTVEVTGWRGWVFPLIVVGANSLVLYVLSVLVKTCIMQVWQWTMPDGSVVRLQSALVQLFTVHAGPIAGGLAYTAVFVSLWWVVTFFLYRKSCLLRA